MAADPRAEQQRFLQLVLVDNLHLNRSHEEDVLDQKSVEQV